MMQAQIDEFISRWRASGGSEMANFQSFAAELADILGVERPKPATSDGQNDDYRFERPVRFIHTGRERRGRIDLYRRGCFIMEGKQGSEASPDTKDHELARVTGQAAPQVRQAGHGRRGTPAFDDAMLKARSQADGYARAVSREDGWPPFLMIVDVGHVIELYADFSRQGQGYTPFPDGRSHRIRLEALRCEETRAMLAAIWNDPYALNPALKTAAVTRTIASHLAELGKSLEKDGHAGEAVARFLMRSLFTMFAEDVGLIEKESFTRLLKDLRGHPQDAEPALNALFHDMDKGGFSSALRARVRQFNGGLFREADALPLSPVQLGLLIEAAEADWSEVEPAIFGTLLERALDEKQRHKLGAHYTPRAYVERLVIPTVIEPLRNDWRDVQAAALTLAKDGKLKEAQATVRDFHTKLCKTRVLDPACGSGNFLYVAMELMKKLEGEVTQLQKDLGDDQALLGLEALTVSPEQFLGLEINVWAKEVADLVLWIGYLQWQYRTFGKANEADPVLQDFHNIEHCDALIDYDSAEQRVDADGNEITVWDRINTISDPAGNEVPDPEARIPVHNYIGPRERIWPPAEFIVGNPPFIGKLKMRADLGDGYVEALRAVYTNVPDSADFVMYWWNKAAEIAQSSRPSGSSTLRRFGFITTRSIRQTFNARILQAYLVHPRKPLSLVLAIPDHPWVDTVLAAKVRIAMTVVETGRKAGTVSSVVDEVELENPADGWHVSLRSEVGTIRPNLRVGTDILSARPLRSNERLCSMGFATGSRGFFLTAQEASECPASERRFLRRILSTHEITDTRLDRYVIDVWEVQSEDELMLTAPWTFNRLKQLVYPKRAENNDPKLRSEWWRFRRSNRDYRGLKSGLDRFLVAPETSKFRIFTFEGPATDVEHGAYGIGLSGAEFLALLSSHLHDVWSLAQGGDLGVTPRYNKTRCFDPFPFPDLTRQQTERLRSLGEALDAHRKARQAEHPHLTLTQMYNVLEKFRALEAARSGETLEGAEKQIWKDGQIGRLKEIHDAIDAAVAEAYGWPADLSDEEILARLVALNRERALEEAAGRVRWLRPEYQNPTGAGVAATTVDAELAGDAAGEEGLPAWPKTLPERIAAVRAALEEFGEASAKQIAGRYRGAGEKGVTPLLESLAALGQAEVLEDGRYAA